MRFPIKIYDVLIIFFCFVHTSSAQQKQGALAFVNAVGLEKPTQILVNGASIRPDGFSAGGVTSFIALPSDSFTLTCKNDNIPCKPLTVAPSPSGSVILVVFESEITGANGEKKQELQALSVPSMRESKGFNQRVLLVGPKSPETFIVNGNQLPLSPGKVSDPINSSDVHIETQSGEHIGDFSSAEPGNFLIVLFLDQNGKYRGTCLRDNFVTFEPPAQSAGN